MRISDWSSDVCSSDLLNEWIEFADLTDGFVFRALSYRVGAAGHLSEGAVSKIIKERLRAYLIALADAGTILQVQINQIVEATSAHSLRVDRKSTRLNSSH